MSIDIKELLAAKHTGMRVDASGILRSRGGSGHGYMRGEMLKNLDEMAERFYAGDVSAVDEFLQLYCLDDKRPK